MHVVECQEAGDFVCRSLGIEIAEPRIALGYVRNDRTPLAAVVLNDHTGANIEITIVAESGGLTRGVLRHLATYVFDQLGCRRVTVRTKKANKPAQRLAKRCGFSFECVAKAFYEDDDAIVFRMLRSDCPWLRKKE